MEKRQVLFVEMHPLLGEGLRRILETLEDVELVCLDCGEWQKIDLCLKDLHPDMVVLAGEKEDDQSTHLIANMLKKYEDIPIVWVELERNTLLLYTSHSLNASSSELIRAIREQDLSKMNVHLVEKKSRRRVE